MSPLFRVQRGKGGNRMIGQVPTGEEPHLAEAPQKEPDAAEEIGLENRPVRKIQPEEPSAAYRHLSSTITKKPKSYLDKYIRELETLEEVDGIRLIETNHPKYDGGRSSVIDELNAQAVRIDQERTKPQEQEAPEQQEETEEQEETEATVEETPDEEKEEAEVFPCPSCDFKASSATGLEEHIFAKHDV